MALKKKAITATTASEQLRVAYGRCFSSRDGKIVLADLNKQFYDGKMDGSDLNREVGKRDVMRHIKTRLNNG
ncbi:MAG: hypothetical protein GY829_15495 [Gammaproteobacteria bacterium]|nr:hypothetical protein [Gammaproteobacteria bacterium]